MKLFKMENVVLQGKKSYIPDISGESGISLVETLVAIAILGVIASVFLTALSTGAISVRIQDEMSVSQGLAQSEIEVIKSAAYDISGHDYPVLNAPTGYTIAVQVNPSIYGNVDIQQVTVTIMHNDDQVLALENYKVNR
jgi:type II secretory pathway pseudopilin PulG